MLQREKFKTAYKSSGKKNDHLTAEFDNSSALKIKLIAAAGKTKYLSHLAMPSSNNKFRLI
jgi:hypothetical protein